MFSDFFEKKKKTIKSKVSDSIEPVQKNIEVVTHKFNKGYSNSKSNSPPKIFSDVYETFQDALKTSNQDGNVENLYENNNSNNDYVNKFQKDLEKKIKDLGKTHFNNNIVKSLSNSKKLNKEIYSINSLKSKSHIKDNSSKMRYFKQPFQPNSTYFERLETNSKNYVKYTPCGSVSKKPSASKKNPSES